MFYGLWFSAAQQFFCGNIVVKVLLLKRFVLKTLLFRVDKFSLRSSGLFKQAGVANSKKHELSQRNLQNKSPDIDADWRDYNENKQMSLIFVVCQTIAISEVSRQTSVRFTLAQSTPTLFQYDAVKK